MTYRWASLHVLKFLVNILAGEGLGVFLHLVARRDRERPQPVPGAEPTFPVTQYLDIAWEYQDRVTRQGKVKVLQVQPAVMLQRKTKNQR